MLHKLRNRRDRDRNHLIKGSVLAVCYKGSRSSLIKASQNAKLSTKFSTLNKDFSEMRKFQAKPWKPRCDTGLKTPNPEGFWITPKSRKVRGD